MTPTPLRARLHHAASGLALTLSLALLAGLAGCGDNTDCVGDQCTATHESCGTAGDEDGNGLADCDDPACTADPACLPQCPNGVQNVGEGCDDGNTVNTDACTNICTRAQCGDSIVQAGVDQCDDGNTANNDGCSATCQTERCGDSVKQTNEACDDGNTVSNDGCSATCHIETCGDGITQTNEQCDDGNMVDTDACTNTCHTAVCGDSITGPGEQCDDGNMSNTDACTNACTSMRCGDGFAQPGEACDDGNMVNTDGCTNTCALPSCGDGFVQAAEQCDDGNMINGDACLNTCMTAVCGDGVQRLGVEECDDANANDNDACRNTCVAARCGDAVIQTNVEQCDDGNMVNTDTCTNVCHTAACGDGFRQGLEACDDGNMINGDGCDNGCVLSGCGNGVVGGAEQCDDANMVNGDGCDNNCKITACGNGIRTGAEACDDGNLLPNDGCSATCTLECGNGMINGAEQCDDGNRILVDGCDNNCKLENNELEPNEDGTPSTGGSGIAGNDFDVGGMLAVTNATAQGLIRATNGSTARLAKVDPLGDEDVFAITNDTASPLELRLDVWNRAATFGVNVVCGTSIDTGLNVRNAAGVVLFSNDDRNGAADRCSGLSMVLAPAATVYAQVVAYGDATAINTPGYGFQVKFIPIVCGDGRLVPGVEECEDGNAAANDGCSPACLVEGTNELEPNEDGTPSLGGTGIAGNDFDVGGMLAVTNATAQGVANIAAGNKNWIAALTPAGDEDVFAVTNNGALTYQVQADTWDPTTGVGNPCPLTMDTGINVRDAAGVVVTSNDTRPNPADNCSRVTFFLAPGQTRYIHVVEYGDNNIITRYVLAVLGSAIVCGNGVQTAGFEECDDGNLANNDGCSAACTVEGANEIEPNEDGTPSVGGSGILGNDFDIGGMLAVNNATAQGVFNVAGGSGTWRAAMNPAGDEDVFVVTNGGAVPRSVQLDTYDLTVGINQPCAITDTGINVRNAAGVVLVSNDTRGTGDNCSRVSFALLPGQTRYVHVTEYQDNNAITKYALVIKSAAVVCGDGIVVSGVETCDDGNVANNDGCSNACAVENGFACNAASPSVCTAVPFRTIALACTDMTGSSTLLAAGDDAVTARAALPFAFNLYTDPVAFYSVSTNGFIGFFAADAGSISSTASNATIVPSSSTPNGILAPFWDDLVLANTGIRTKLVGAAGARVFTIEWNASIYLVTPSNVVFQVQIKEGGPVEYHYCSATGDAARTGGSGATVAAENLLGTVGHAAGINQQVITPGVTAFRWTF